MISRLLKRLICVFLSFYIFSITIFYNFSFADSSVAVKLGSLSSNVGYSGTLGPGAIGIIPAMQCANRHVEVMDKLAREAYDSLPLEEKKKYKDYTAYMYSSEYVFGDLSSEALDEMRKSDREALKLAKDRFFSSVVEGFTTLTGALCEFYSPDILDSEFIFSVSNKTSLDSALKVEKVYKHFDNVSSYNYDVNLLPSLGWMYESYKTFLTKDVKKYTLEDTAKLVRDVKQLYKLYKPFENLKSVNIKFPVTYFEIRPNKRDLPDYNGFVYSMFSHISDSYFQALGYSDSDSYFQSKNPVTDTLYFGIGVGCDVPSNISYKPDFVSFLNSYKNKISDLKYMNNEDYYRYFYNGYIDEYNLTTPPSMDVIFPYDFTSFDTKPLIIPNGYGNSTISRLSTFTSRDELKGFFEFYKAFEKSDLYNFPDNLEEKKLYYSATLRDIYNNLDIDSVRAVPESYAKKKKELVPVLDIDAGVVSVPADYDKLKGKKREEAIDDVKPKDNESEVEKPKDDVIGLRSLLLDVSKLFDRLISAIERFFNNLENFLENILNGIRSVLDRILENLGKVLDNIRNLPESIGKSISEAFQKLIDAIKSLFIPKDTFFTMQNARIKTKMLSKLDVNVLKALPTGDVGLYPFDDIYIDLLGHRVKVLDFSMFRQVIPQIKVFTDPIFYLFYLLFIYNEIYFIIRGVYPLRYKGDD